MIVLDASVTLAWLLEDETSDLAVRALQAVVADGALVPSHWSLEVLSGLAAAERRGRLTRNVAEIIADLAGLAIDVDAPLAIDGPLFDFAKATNLTLYDAAYLATATARSMQLATLDRSLASAARSAGVLFS